MNRERERRVLTTGRVAVVWWLVATWACALVQGAYGGAWAGALFCLLVVLLIGALAKCPDDPGHW